MLSNKSKEKTLKHIAFLLNKDIMLQTIIIMLTKNKYTGLIFEEGRWGQIYV